MKSNYLGICILLVMVAWSCQNKLEPLPVLGNKIYKDGDTLDHTIPEFRFVNQDSQWVTNATFRDKAYVVDFFFTSCPTICPKVKKQMLRLQETFKKEDRIRLLSHSIDTRRDSVPRLKVYAENLGVNGDKWHLVTGKKEDIYGIAEDYFSVAKEDPEAPGGYDHSGRLILVDPKGRVRSFCDGTDKADVNRFMKDINRLLNEMDDSM